MSEEVKDRLAKAREAAVKKAAFGDDIDLTKYETRPPEAPAQITT